jgi:hypothetical protein
MSLYHFKSCMSRSWTTWSQWVSLAERDRSSFQLFVSVLCVGFSLSLLVMLLALSAGIYIAICHRCRVLKKVFTSRARWLLL